MFSSNRIAEEEANKDMRNREGKNSKENPMNENDGDNQSNSDEERVKHGKFVLDVVNDEDIE